MNGSIKFSLILYAVLAVGYTLPSESNNGGLIQSSQNVQTSLMVPVVHGNSVDGINLEARIVALEQKPLPLGIQALVPLVTDLTSRVNNVQTNFKALEDRVTILEKKLSPLNDDVIATLLAMAQKFKENNNNFYLQSAVAAAPPPPAARLEDLEMEGPDYSIENVKSQQARQQKACAIS